MHDVLLIPGVGGHPAFHRLLIEGLAGRFRIHTSAHGDFFAAPFNGLRAHVDYWATIAGRISHPPSRVVAISFGVHVVPGLVERFGAWPARLALVSPWIPDTLGRCGLRLLASAPRRPAARWLAGRLMRWTDRRRDHAGEIARLRAELYDDPQRVADRWLARTLSIAGPQALTWPWVARAARQTRLTVIFGRDEWLYRVQRSPLASAARRGVRVVELPGRHDLSAFATPEMLAATTRALE